MTRHQKSDIRNQTAPTMNVLTIDNPSTTNHLTSEI
jgi:hypothetical protein